MSFLHPDRLFPADPVTRSIAKRLYASVEHLPILSPHGHTEAKWFAENISFPNPTELFILPDHYVHRMLYSQGIPLEQIGLSRSEPCDLKEVWRLFASHYYLFRGTPTRMWLDYAFQELFGLTESLCGANADVYYETISAKLALPEFQPRALYDRFHIEVLSTTNSPLETLADHQKIRDSQWKARILPTFRPDAVVDPDYEGFQNNLARLGEMSGEDVGTWKGYLRALEKTRERFKALGCKATDHGHPTAATADLGPGEAERLYEKVCAASSTADERALFRAQMLTEMARMSVEDGLTMQIHPGSFRNHNRAVFERFGRDMGADIPTATDYVHALQPMLNRFGNEPGLIVILFTLDESAYSRELAPLAGHYPALRLGPPWWFYDSPEGMLRFRESTTETAGFYNTVGFNDDTRAFLSIPGRHDMARRMDCGYLARLVAEHRLKEEDAHEVAIDLTYTLAKRAYKL
ncbi:MAG TPA: glucuronate isomerase [Acidobacteriaceae bacterium]|nr:glucuronate isomerase [Acidobacteriaceae bacterium]